MSAEEESGEELLLLYVQEALSSKSGGGRTRLYDQLVAEVGRLSSEVQGVGDATASASAALVGLLAALTGSASHLHPRAHESLLRGVLGLSPWRVGDAVRGALLEFVVHLSAAQGEAVGACLAALAGSLVPPPGPPTTEALGSAWIPDSVEAGIQDEVLACTARVLRLVPTAAPRLLPLLVDGLPHALRERRVHCLTARALVSLAEAGGPGGPLREALLAALAQHALTLDVEIRWEDIVDVPSAEAKEEVAGLTAPDDDVDIFELEGMTAAEAEAGGCRAPAHDPRGGWEGAAAALVPGTVSDSATSPAPRDGPTLAAQQMADKLDSVMELVLTHVNHRVATQDLDPAFQTLLTVFERRVLHVHRSKFTQFLVFHAAARDVSGAAPRALLASLLVTLRDEGVANITRTAAAAYLASFLARARFLPQAVVVQTLLEMVCWAQQYAARTGSRTLPRIASGALFLQGVDAAELTHAAFHATVQGVLYVLCYTMEVLLADASRGLAQEDSTGDLALGSSLTLEDKVPAPRGSVLPPGAAVTATHSTRAGPTRSTAGPASLAPDGSGQPSEREALDWMLDSALPELLEHGLDPLSACAPSVAAEFGRQARRRGLCRAARAVASWRQRAAAARTAHRPLEVFFPFDPYLLARSAELLDLPRTYVGWRRGRRARGGASGSRADVGAGPAGATLVEDDLYSSSDDDDDGDSGLSGSEAASASTSSSSSSTSQSSDDDASSSSSSDSSTSSERDSGLPRDMFGSPPMSSGGASGRRWEPIAFGEVAGGGRPRPIPTARGLAPGALSPPPAGSSLETDLQFRAGHPGFVPGESMSSDGMYGASLPHRGAPGTSWAAGPMSWRDASGAMPMSYTPGR